MSMIQNSEIAREIDKFLTGPRGSGRYLRRSPERNAAERGDQQCFGTRR